VAAPPDPWRLPVETPAGLSPELRRLHETTERFRVRVVEAAFPDDYRWQDGMLRFLARQRDEATVSNLPVDPATRIMFRRIVDNVRALEELRRSESRPLAGPAPTDAVRRRAWLALRDPRYVPLEDELDALLDELYRGHAPELEHEAWVSGFLSCLIVCERHFEERARLGAAQAGNSELVRRQWDPVVAAVDALDALTALP
jgi:hypothetical protein